MKRLLALAIFTAVLSAQTRPTMFPPVRGTHEMVGAANNFEVEAGFRLLTQGGNAVDAGVASVLAASVTEQSRFGLGGEMPLLIKMNGNGHVEASAPEFQPIPAVINATQARAFWSAVKQGAKTEKQVLDYFGSLGIERTEEMRKQDFDGAMRWAIGREADNAVI